MQWNKSHIKYVMEIYKLLWKIENPWQKAIKGKVIFSLFVSSKRKIEVTECVEEQEIEKMKWEICIRDVQKLSVSYSLAFSEYSPPRREYHYYLYVVFVLLFYFVPYIHTYIHTSIYIWHSFVLVHNVCCMPPLNFWLIQPASPAVCAFSAMSESCAELTTIISVHKQDDVWEIQR